MLLAISSGSLYSFVEEDNIWNGPIAGHTYSTTKRADGVIAYDRLYITSPDDPLTYFDPGIGDIITFTSRSAPTSPACTRSGGSAGSYTFSYKITTVTATGETTPTAAVSATVNQATLSVSVKMQVSWSAATGALGYNVYGNKDGNWYFMKYVEGNSSTSYEDTGVDTPNELFTPPTENTTAGPSGVDIEQYKDSLFVIGDEDNPSRLYYSAGGDKIHDFSASNGGGFIDISKNDGQTGTALKVFKNTLLVFKEGSVYQFAFATSGAPQVTQVTSAVGCVATRSVVTVENDVFFCDRRGVFSIGNEAGFAFDVLRTNELSARVRSVYQTIDPAYIGNISATYATKNNVNLVIFSYTPSGSTTNSKALVYDRERLAWYEWTNVSANCWATNIGVTDDAQHVLYGDDSGGYLKEILSGDDDFGSNIIGSFKLKAETFKGDLVRYFDLKDVSVALREPIGVVNLSVIVDGSTTAMTTNASTVSPSINFGHYVFKEFLFGSSYGTGSVSTSDEIVLRTKKNVNIRGKSFTLRFTNSPTGSFTLLSTELTAKPRSDRYRASTDLISD